MANSIYADALVKNFTIYKNKESMLNGSILGVDNFATWKSACDKAFEAFYKYQTECVDVAIASDETKANTTAAFDALQTILDLIGEYNGRKLRKSPEMLTLLTPYAVKEKKGYVGEAFTVNEDLKQLKKDQKNIRTGMSEEYIRNLERQITIAEERLNTLSKQYDSADKKDIRNSETTFRRKLEEKLAKILREQKPQTWEEAEAEKAAKKAAQKERHKEQRKAKREAEARANAVAQQKAQ